MTNGTAALFAALYEPSCPVDLWLNDGTLKAVAAANLDPSQWAEYAYQAKKRRLDMYQLMQAIKAYAPKGALITVALSSIDPEEVSWLWEPYLALRKLTLIEGDPSVGKTYLVLAIAAAVTHGYSMPDQHGRVGKPAPSQAGNVLYITAEDGLADTIRPRADKVGADVDRIFVVSPGQEVSLTNPEPIAEAIARHNARLLVLDPLQAFLGSEMDMNTTNQVRPFMHILSDMADKYNCAMLAIRHWTKASGGKARYRGQGSIDFTAAARGVLAIGESPEDESLRILAQSKNSLGRLGVSLVFKISEEGLEWCGTSELTADELSAMQPKKRQHQRNNAMQWLKDYLHDGPQASQDVIAAAEAVGIAEKTLRRAKEVLGVLASREKGNGPWYWRLPKFEPWDRYEKEDDEPF